jgi:hypothetical protein
VLFEDDFKNIAVAPPTLIPSAVTLKPETVVAAIEPRWIFAFEIGDVVPKPTFPPVNNVSTLLEL